MSLVVAVGKWSNEELPGGDLLPETVFIPESMEFSAYVVGKFPLEYGLNIWTRLHLFTLPQNADGSHPNFNLMNTTNLELPEVALSLGLQGAELVRPGVDGANRFIPLCDDVDGSCPKTREDAKDGRHQCTGLLGKEGARVIYWVGCSSLEGEQWYAAGTGLEQHQSTGGTAEFYSLPSALLESEFTSIYTRENLKQLKNRNFDSNLLLKALKIYFLAAWEASPHQTGAYPPLTAQDYRKNDFLEFMSAMKAIGNDTEATFQKFVKLFAEQTHSAELYQRANDKEQAAMENREARVSVSEEADTYFRNRSTEGSAYSSTSIDLPESKSISVANMTAVLNAEKQDRSQRTLFFEIMRNDVTLIGPDREFSNHDPRIRMSEPIARGMAMPRRAGLFAKRRMEVLKFNGSDRKTIRERLAAAVGPDLPIEFK